MSLDPQAILELHKSYADEFTSLAQSGLTSAFSALSNSGIYNYHPAQISIKFPDLGAPKTVGALPSAPISPTLPIAPTLLPLVEIPNANLPNAPVSSLGSVPGYGAPTKPTTGTPTFDAVAPSVPGAPAMPAVPSYLSLPSLTLPYPTVNVPTSPIITTPNFEGRRPNDISPVDPAAIVTTYTTERDAHRNMLPAFARANADTLLAQYVPEFSTLRSQINNAIARYTDPTSGGGVGVPANVETAILARASDRNALEFQRGVETATDTIGKRGFFMPQGMLQAAVKQAALAMGDAQVRGSIDVATKSMELEQQHFQFMLKLGEQLEEKVLETITQYLTLSLQMDQQAIASAKEIVTTYLGAYNLQVMVYKAMWEGYQVDAEVFKARIAALDAQVRLYEGQIRAELAKTEVNKATVDVLQAVAAINRSLADTYRAQVEAATATLEVSRLQTAIFEARVRAYASEVAAYDSRWHAYEAEVNGELGKFKAYEAQANGYMAQVGAYRAQVESYVALVDAAAKTNQALGGRNESAVRVYAAQNDAALKAFDALVAEYSAVSNVTIKQSEIEVEFWRAKANLIMGEFNAALNGTFEYAREQMNLFRGQMEAAVNAGNGLAHAANVAGSLASGAMTGLTSFAGSLVSSQA